MNIVFLDAYTTDFGDIDLSLFSLYGNYTSYDYTSSNEIAERVANADILIVNKNKVDEYLLSIAKNLKYIIVSATGYNNIDTVATKKYNIPVSNVRGYSTDGVAQYVLASILQHCNKLSYYHKEVANGRWEKSRDFCFYDHSILDVADLHIGIIGFGTIGKRVATLLKPFNCKISAYTHYEIPKEYEFVNRLDLNELLSTTDVISLHTPLNDETKQLINAQTLSKVKKEVLLINTGRGALIDENDLAIYLKNNIKATAMIDVLSIEPPSNGNPLLGLPNCLVTPHLAWASKQSREKLVKGIIDNISKYLEGNLINLV